MFVEHLIESFYVRLQPWLTIKLEFKLSHTVTMVFLIHQQGWIPW